MDVKIECSFLFFDYRFVFIGYQKQQISGIATSAPFLSHLAFHSYGTRSVGQQCMMSSSQWYNNLVKLSSQEVQQQPSGLLSPDEGGLQLEKPDSPSALAEGEKKDDLNVVSLSGVRRKAVCCDDGNCV